MTELFQETFLISVDSVQAGEFFERQHSYKSASPVDVHSRILKGKAAHKSTSFKSCGMLWGVALKVSGLDCEAGNRMQPEETSRAMCF